MYTRALRTLVFGLTLALLAAPVLAADKPPIKIGLLYSLSGMAAVVTQGTVIGHEIAAEEINAKGGDWAVRSNTWYVTISSNPAKR